MARRSSRLRGNTPAKPTTDTANNLESVTERDETPMDGHWASLGPLASSPVLPRTPKTASRPKPGMEEMHPSKAHHSTAQQPDSGLRLGFTDINTTGGSQPFDAAQQTPSKAGISTPTFDFRFARPGPTLGPEAQRMMNELREEALRIKAKLAAEKEEQQRQNTEAASIQERRIAKPRGKVGRYSDVHMEQFKKMDSIAGHPSAFRAQPDRFVPAATSLKRKQSKVNLDEREDVPAKAVAPAAAQDAERLENSAPTKRARRKITDDTSVTRPRSRDTTVKPTTPSIPRPQSIFPAAITTPTQSSLARASAAKHRFTQIPSSSKSALKKHFSGTPQSLAKSATTSNINVAPKSEPRSFLRSPGRFDRVKSILRHASSSMKKPTIKPSSIASLNRSPSKLGLEKTLSSLPMTPHRPVISKSAKHVNFTPETVNKNAAASQHSPSPMKSSIPRSVSKSSLRSKTCHSESKSNDVHYPSIADHPNIAHRSQEVEYPSLAGLRRLPAEQSATPPHPPPSVPGTFTFRSDHTISFGASPKSFGSSPGQASVRQVRQSILSGVPGSFPKVDKENVQPLPSVPHGMTNKKRRRVDSDDETEDDATRSLKKHKANVAEGPMLVAPRLHATPKSRLNSPAKKGAVLSLSRLNMLARPKNRK